MNSKLDEIFAKNQLKKSLSINEDDLCSDLDVSALLAKSSVPYSHRRIADNYNILRKICSFQVVQPRITKSEEILLKKYSFNTLENTTITKANAEISQLKNWATSTNDTLRKASVDLLNVRVKELKFMLSNNYTNRTNECNKGYKAIETYLTEISKYYR